MPRTPEPGQETTLNLRLDSSLKAEFVSAAESENQPVAKVLRRLMRAYIAEANRKRFAAEARRQSQSLVRSKDEAEVMRWIQDVSASKRGR